MAKAQGSRHAGRDRKAEGPGAPRTPGHGTADRDGLAARRAAVSLYRAVCFERRPLDEAFAQAAEQGSMAALAPRDRALARRLVACGLRRRGQLRLVLDGLLDKGRLPRHAPALEALLVIGLAELLFLGTPAHAAVNAAVILARGHRDTAGLAGLVNAVLRRAARDLTSAEAIDARAPVSANTPDWLAARWRRHYGADTAAAFAVALAEEPPLDLTVKTDPEAWAERLQGRLLPTGTVRLALGGRIEALPGFAEGAWWVQDAAAALPARFFGPVSGQPVLDLCAAPGGKTAELAAEGAEVIAIDRDRRRLSLLRDNLKRLGLSATVIEADATAFQSGRRFPMVLLDAPCSATGTIRRHPDIAWLKSEADIAALAAEQARLLDSACGFLAPGGTLIYAVCSLEPEEGEAQIEALLKRRPDLKRRPLDATELPGIAPFVTATGDLRTRPSDWPEWGGLDGFFAARLSYAPSRA